MTVIEGVGTWPDMCRKCKLRPCGCDSEAAIGLAFAAVMSATNDEQPAGVRRRLGQIAALIDSLPVRNDEMREVLESLDGNVCMACGRESVTDVCNACFDAMICPHEERRDECLFCADC